jgi:ABC-type antimicrobial peptide transport system permease subunit
MPGLLQALSVHRMRVSQALSFNEALFKSARHRVLPAWLFGLLGGSSLVILGAGILGMLAMSVSQRTREMGIRLALGSTPAGIVRIIVGEQLRPVLVGLAAGAGIAIWAVVFLESQLYGVSAWDPGVWTSVAATVLGTAIAGSVIPSVRSAMTDPVAALRSE